MDTWREKNEKIPNVDQYYLPFVGLEPQTRRTTAQRCTHYATIYIRIFQAVIEI